MKDNEYFSSSHTALLGWIGGAITGVHDTPYSCSVTDLSWGTCIMNVDSQG
jgi:hypothetical protein